MKAIRGLACTVVGPPKFHACLGWLITQWLHCSSPLGCYVGNTLAIPPWVYGRACWGAHLLAMMPQGGLCPPRCSQAHPLSCSTRTPRAPPRGHWGALDWVVNMSFGRAHLPIVVTRSYPGMSRDILPLLAHTVHSDICVEHFACSVGESVHNERVCCHCCRFCPYLSERFAVARECLMCMAAWNLLSNCSRQAPVGAGQGAAEKICAPGLLHGTGWSKKISLPGQCCRFTRSSLPTPSPGRPSRIAFAPPTALSASAGAGAIPPALRDHTGARGDGVRGGGGEQVGPLGIERTLDS